LQTGDQVVGLAGAFGQIFDLVVLDGDFRTQKDDLPVFLFESLCELRDILNVGRDLSSGVVSLVMV